MNKEKEETNYMLSYISSRTDDILADDYIGQIADYIIKLQQENQQLKKQKDDVVEYIKSNCIVSDEWTELDFCNFVPTGKVNYKALNKEKVKNLLRMLGDKDVED